MDNINNIDINDKLDGTVSGEVLASIFGVTVRRVQQLAADGVIKKGDSRGQYIFAAAVRGYIQFLQKNGVVDEDLAKERLIEEINNLKLKNKKLQTVNDRDDGVLVETSAAREQMAIIAKTGLQVLETLPDILERDYQLDASIIAGVETKIDALRNDWADMLEELS